jgi:NitT/TauT family transport system substrate-binding protein
VRRRDLLAAAAALAGCRRAIEGRELVVAASPYITMAPLYLAIEEKRFERAGIETKLERVAGSTQALPMLAGGKLDVAFLSLSAGIVNAILRGARLRVVAGREHARESCGDPGGLLIRKKSFPGGLRDLKELKGKRVSIPAGSAGMAAFWMDIILTQGGLSPGDIHPVVAGRSEEIAAMASGRMDAAMTSAPVDMIRPEWAKEVDHISIASRLIPGFQYSFIYFGARVLDGAVETGARFLRIYHGAVKDFAGGATPNFLRDFAESNGHAFEAVRKRCRTSASLDGTVDLPSIQRFLDWSAAKGFSDRPAQAAELIDTRFLEASRRSEGSD